MSCLFRQNILVLGMSIISHVFPHFPHSVEYTPPLIHPDPSMSFRGARRRVRSIKHGTAPSRPQIVHSSYDVASGGHLELRERELHYLAPGDRPAKRPRRESSPHETSDSVWEDIDNTGEMSINTQFMVNDEEIDTGAGPSTSHGPATAHPTGEGIGPTNEELTKKKNKVR